MGLRLIMKYMISTNLKHFKQVLMPNPHQRNFNLYIYMYVLRIYIYPPRPPIFPHRLPWKSHLRQTHKDVDSALKLNFESSHPKWKLEHFHAEKTNNQLFFRWYQLSIDWFQSFWLMLVIFCLLKTHLHPWNFTKRVCFPGYHFHPRFPPGGNLYPTKKRSISDSVVQPSRLQKAVFQTWKVGRFHRVETLPGWEIFFLIRWVKNEHQWSEWMEIWILHESWKRMICGKTRGRFLVWMGPPRMQSWRRFALASKGS